MGHWVRSRDRFILILRDRHFPQRDAVPESDFALLFPNRWPASDSVLPTVNEPSGTRNITTPAELLYSEVGDSDMTILPRSTSRRPDNRVTAPTLTDDGCSISNPIPASDRPTECNLAREVARSGPIDRYTGRHMRREKPRHKSLPNKELRNTPAMFFHHKSFLHKDLLTIPSAG